MAKKQGPYVCLEGVTSRAQIEHALKSVPKTSAWRLAPGVQVCSAEYAASLAPAEASTSRFVNQDDLAGIFFSDPRLLNLVQCFTKTTAPVQLAKEICSVMEAAGPFADGLRLHLQWPSEAVLQTFRERFPDSLLILHMGPELRLLPSISHFRRQIESYQQKKLADGFVIDLGDTTPKPPVAKEYEPYLHVLVRHRDFVSCVAGSVEAMGSTLLLDLLKIEGFQNLSYSVGTLLRTSPPGDTLDPVAVEVCLRRLFRMFVGTKQEELAHA